MAGNAVVKTLIRLEVKSTQLIVHGQNVRHKHLCKSVFVSPTCTSASKLSS